MNPTQCQWIDETRRVWQWINTTTATYQRQLQTTTSDKLLQQCIYIVMGVTQRRLRLRRKGFTASILKAFFECVGVTRKDNVISPNLLDACARNELNVSCSRVIIINYPADRAERIECPGFPQKKKKIAPRILWHKKFFGLTKGKTVRLKWIIHGDRSKTLCFET